MGQDWRAVVHLGVMHNPRDSTEDHHSWNVVAFQRLLEYAERYGVPKVVLLSSANVYGPRPDNPQFLNEEAPLLGAGAFSDIRDLVGLDMAAQSFLWRYPKTTSPCRTRRSRASNRCLQSSVGRLFMRQMSSRSMTRLRFRFSRNGRR